MHSTLLQRTQAFTHLITRRGIQAKYKQPLVAHSEVTSTFIRRDHTFTHHDNSHQHHCHHRQDGALGVPGLLHENTSKCWLCTRVRETFSHLHRRTRMNITQTQKQCGNAPTRQFIAVISSGHLFRCAHLHFGKCLCRSSISVFATIQSRPQKCGYLLSGILRRSGILRQSARANHRVGRVKCHRHECHFHECDIL